MTADQIAREALPVNPMNGDDDRGPISYPLVLPTTLSEDAQHVYLRGPVHTARLDRDLFDRKKRNGHVTREEAQGFQPTERMLAAIAELEAAGLARYSAEYGHNLYLTRVHEAYTYARGRGSQLIRVSVFDERPEDARLLAVLIGADIESRDSRSGAMTELAVRARHEDATDFEHDASSTALLVLRNTTPPVFTGHGRMTFTGVLTEANLYPIGTDVLATSDGDTDAGKICTDCAEPHPFAPYQPPKVEQLAGPHFVTVECLPIRPYLVEAPPLQGTPDTAESETS